jgi:hypothetical protein
MEPNIDCFPVAPNTKRALSVLLDALTDTLNYPEATLTAAAVVPLLTVILDSNHTALASVLGEADHHAGMC